MIPDLTPIFYLAIFGIICGAFTIAGGVLGGIWFLANHVQIVW